MPDYGTLSAAAKARAECIRDCPDHCWHWEPAQAYAPRSEFDAPPPPTRRMCCWCGLEDHRPPHGTKLPRGWT